MPSLRFLYPQKKLKRAPHLDATCWNTCFWGALFEAFYIPKESWKGQPILKPHVERHVSGVPFLKLFYIPKESWKGQPILKPHVERHVFGVPFLKLFTSPKKAEKGTQSWSHMLKDMFSGCPFWAFLHPQRKLKRAPHLEAKYPGLKFDRLNFWRDFLHPQRKLKRAPHLEDTRLEIKLNENPFFGGPFKMLKPRKTEARAKVPTFGLLGINLQRPVGSASPVSKPSLKSTAGRWWFTYVAKEPKFQILAR